jgi:glutamate dehydrogenase (NAD(P)+)
VQGATAIVQGFGNVGSHAAITLDSYDVKITGVSDVTGAIWNSGGLPVAKLRKHVAKTGAVTGFKEAEAIDPDELLIQRCDILAPCALDRVITKENASQLKCRILAEGANGPTTPEADLILNQRDDIFIIPDVLCNAGGVTVSYFEWVQNLQHYAWTEREVLSKTENKLQHAQAAVVSFAKKHKLSQRAAAQAIAIKTVAAAKSARGLFP